MTWTICYYLTNCSFPCRNTFQATCVDSERYAGTRKSLFNKFPKFKLWRKNIAMLIWRFFFIFFSGNLRRFRRICEHTQSVVSVVRRQPLPPASPRAARRNSTNKSDGGSDSRPQPPSRSTDGAGSRTTGKNEVSDSSSCNSDVSHGIEPNSKNGPSSNVLTVPSGS